jgi:hypothetical protein
MKNRSRSNRFCFRAFPLVFPFMCLECGVSRGLIFISNSLQSIDEGGGEGFGSMALQSGWVAAVYEYPNDK